jgi:hypothetical protein
VSDLSLKLGQEALDAIAELVAEKIRSSEPTSPWLTRKQAAEHLGVPVSRLEKDRSVPLHRWGGRVLYHRDEIDTYLLKGEAK